MYEFAGESEPDLEQLRKRLQRMSDQELKRFGSAARYMCSPKANAGKPPRQTFMIQLQEAQAEWRLRRVESE